jgi:hypothetical protein
MLYGLSGRDCTIIVSNWSSYASDGRAREFPWPVMPLVREITVPLSFFTVPVKSVGADTYATIATGVIPPRTLSATFFLQASHLTNPVLFPFTKYPVSFFPPFYMQHLRVAFVNPFAGGSFVVVDIPKAVPTRWEFQVRENTPATISITWAFNMANLVDTTLPLLSVVDPNDEFITIRNIALSFDPPHVPPHGIVGATVRINVPVAWRHRVEISPFKFANDFSINRWDVELQFELSPDAVLWLWRSVEFQPHTGVYRVVMTLYPEEAVPATFSFYSVRLSEGSTSVRVEGSLEATVSLRALDFSYGIQEREEEE